MTMSTIVSDQEVIDRALSFPMENITRRYAAEQGLRIDTAREHERELKRFLVLCALNPSYGYGMSGPLDDLWHTFLVYTREYAAFCEQVAGFFIHHAPTDTNNVHTQFDYRLTLEDYEKIYGEQAPSSIWPQPAGQYDEMIEKSLHHCGRPPFQCLDRTASGIVTNHCGRPDPEPPRTC